MLAALKHLKSLEPLATNMSSAELRALQQGVKAKSIFSARMNLYGMVQDLKQITENYLSGASNLATESLNYQSALDAYGYTPEGGFPGAPDASIPGAESGTLQDLRSDARTRLVLQTNFRQATNFMKAASGNEPDALEQFPAWELIRVYSRQIPRGEKRGPKGSLMDDPGNDWPSRFRAAAEAAGDDDALRVLDETGRMIARKDSPIWDELGNPDNFDDAIGTSYPPFAFNSGYGWSEVDRAECVDIELIGENDQIAPTDNEFGSELAADADSATLADLKATREALLAAAKRLRAGGA